MPSIEVKFLLSYICIETRLITSASYKFATSIAVQRASFVSLTLGSEIMKRGSEMDARKWRKSERCSLAPYGKTQKRIEWAFKRVAADSHSGSTRPECYTTSSTMAEAAASYNTVGNGRNFYRIGGGLTGREGYCESSVPRLRLTGLWNSCSPLRRAAHNLYRL